MLSDILTAGAVPPTYAMLLQPGLFSLQTHLFLKVLSNSSVPVLSSRDCLRTQIVPWSIGRDLAIHLYPCVSSAVHALNAQITSFLPACFPRSFISIVLPSFELYEFLLLPIPWPLVFLLEGVGWPSLTPLSKSDGSGHAVLRTEWPPSA